MLLKRTRIGCFACGGSGSSASDTAEGVSGAGDGGDGGGSVTAAWVSAAPVCASVPAVWAAASAGAAAQDSDTALPAASGGTVASCSVGSPPQIQRAENSLPQPMAGSPSTPRSIGNSQTSCPLHARASAASALLRGAPQFGP